jgi:ubiquinone/menaquinone biosynthesis C-methylase UbiE
MQNWSIKDEIRDYWSLRAETYDASPGHGIARHAEIDAWSRLIRRHIGDGDGRTALDLACGTGVMTMLMHGLGFKVTGLDFTKPMMARARRKSDEANAAIRFLTRDAEETMEPDNTYDVIIARHLVWTLTNPDKAFADWLRILKPGGRLLIIDGDFVRQHWLERLLPLLDRVFGKQQDGHSLLTPEQWAHHERIVGQLHFKHGIRTDDALRLFKSAGFGEMKIDTDLADIRRSRGIKLISRKGLASTLQHRFAISGRKPL